MVEPLINAGQREAFCKALSMELKSKRRCVLSILLQRLPAGSCAILKAIVDLVLALVPPKDAAAHDERLAALSNVVSPLLLRGADGSVDTGRGVVAELAYDRDHLFRHVMIPRRTDANGRVGMRALDENVLKKHASKVSSKLVRIVHDQINGGSAAAGAGVPSAKS